MAWDARTTVFEFRVGSPPDTSKGVAKYVFHNWTNEMRTGNEAVQTEMVEAVRKLAL